MKVGTELVLPTCFGTPKPGEKFATFEAKVTKIDDENHRIEVTDDNGIIHVYAYGVDIDPKTGLII